MEEFILRIGTYFLVIGTGIFILFIASDFAQQTNFDYLFWAVLIVTIGILIRRRKPPAPPSGRFSFLKKMREGSKKK
ncbi:MAG: hypothetical protein HYR70_13930 [Chloroflexi bacterium]|nr:hypothetical protein [Chloroflexota bacterium]MBI1854732.1 hypothetical protein [Chloroflexota bacterium]MBI2758297.1 hypothetical protein [Chloroflexota bacterium]MBI3339731.1 hypothetical protein [Chloroflexota bacterium]